MSEAFIRLVLQSLDPSERPWFGGPSPAGSLRNVSNDLAIWRGQGLTHCIWELALHIAYWEYAVLRVLENGPRGGFPRTPSNWPALPDDPCMGAWKADRMLVKHQRDALLRAIRELDPKHLDTPISVKTGRTRGQLLLGIAQHSAYHTGQMAVLKRMGT